jgi:hypothetical protein
MNIYTLSRVNPITSAQIFGYRYTNTTVVITPKIPPQFWTRSHL